MISDSPYHAAFRAAPMPMLLLAADAPSFTVIDINDAGCSTLQTNHQTAVGKNVVKIFPTHAAGQTPNENPLPELQRAIVQAIKTRAQQQVPGAVSASSDGEKNRAQIQFWKIIVTPLADPGKMDRLLLTFENAHVPTGPHDVHGETHTQLNAAHPSAKTAGEGTLLLELIINIIQAGVVLFAPIRSASGDIIDFEFRIANKMAAAYVGQSAEALTGECGSSWFPGYLTNGLFERCKTTAITDTTDRFEFHYNADGIDVWLDIMITKVADDVLVTFTDYTSLKNLQHRLEEHLKQLRASNTNLEQFAYIASHDLQEPLRKIKSFGDLLQGRYGNVIDASGADLIARMQKAASRMATLINDLLTFSRVSVKPSNPEVVDMNKVLQDVLFDLEQSIRQHKANIQSDLLLPMRGQDTQIGQLLLNILSNALKFQHPNRASAIRITSEVVSGDNSGIAVASNDRLIPFQRIRIKDNGIGFEPQYRERIFQIFQRLHGRSEYPGTGVGLSIVQKVVENHNGYITADAVPGEGATFTILLPLIV